MKDEEDLIQSPSAAALDDAVSALNTVMTFEVCFQVSLPTLRWFL